MDEELELNIDDLFNDQNDDTTNSNETNSDTRSELTKAMSDRINSVKHKTKTETEDRIAKELGYNSYAELQKAKERELLKDAGVDDSEMEEVINKLVEQRLNSDPRMKKLEELEQIEKSNFVKSQLNDINEFGEKYTAVDQLPKEVLTLWEKTGNLKQAYLAIKGEELIKNKNKYMNGSTTHLANTGTGSSKTKTRGLTEEEKAIYRMVMPDITEEELSKKTKLVN